MQGQGLVSYGLILGLVALIVVVGLGVGINAGWLPAWCCWLPLALAVLSVVGGWFTRFVGKRRR